MKSAARHLTRLDAVASYPLGIDPTESFKTATVQLRAADTLLLYTDGITEARDANHTMFEVEQLESAFRESSVSPDQIITYLRARVVAHQRGQNPLDDQTLVAATKR
jgi:sigma-B regulation protein RsbU (phosphoserine phosphatase)